MKRFHVRYANGQTEEIEADEFLPNASVASFLREQQRPSLAMKAEPGDIVRYNGAFRAINWRLIDEVREIAPA